MKMACGGVEGVAVANSLVSPTQERVVAIAVAFWSSGVLMGLLYSRMYVARDIVSC